MALTAAAAINKNSLHVWHTRLGHLSKQNVKQLVNIANGINLKKAIPHNDTYIACAKQSISSEPHINHIDPGTYPNKLIHSDLVSPLSISTASAKYFVTFLDNKTKGSEVHFLKDKSRAFSAFKNFKIRWEYGHNTIKQFHIDYGGEYADHNFELFQYKHEIR